MLAPVAIALIIVSKANATPPPFPSVIGTWCGSVSNDFDEGTIEIAIDEQRGGVFKGTWSDNWSSSGLSFEGPISGTVSRKDVLHATLRAPGQGVAATRASGSTSDGTIEGTYREGKIEGDFALTNDPSACE